MLTLIYPYRNRDLKRIKRSLESLCIQTDMDFNVHFVDYGSDPNLAKQVQQLVSEYDFTIYTYHYTQHQPWNKSRALNSAIKHLEDDYFFVADVDMIFREDFIETAISLQQPNSAVYFKVGFLSEKETSVNKEFKEYKIAFESSKEDTGLTMFPTAIVQQLRGFDEFYHFWGSEDTNVHVRLKNAGYQVKFYERDILMLHQWHKSYRRKEQNILTEDLQLSGVVRLNYRHLQETIANKSTLVNPTSWGVPMSRSDFIELSEYGESKQEILNTKDCIDHFLFQQLPNLHSGIYRFIFCTKTKPSGLKHYFKKKNEVYLTMKAVNDMLLLHIISFYRNCPYLFRVDAQANRIQLTIKKL